MGFTSLLAIPRWYAAPLETRALLQIKDLSNRFIMEDTYMQNLAFGCSGITQAPKSAVHDPRSLEDHVTHHPTGEHLKVQICPAPFGSICCFRSIINPKKESNNPT